MRGTVPLQSTHRRRSRHGAVVASAIVAAGLLGACSSDATSTPSSSTTAGTVTSATTSTTSEGGSDSSQPTTTAPDPGTTNATGPASTGNAEIDALIARERTATYHVTYSNNRNQTLDVFRDGERLKVSSGDQSFYQLADGRTYQCDTVATPSCLSLPDGDGALDSMLSQLYSSFGAALVGSENASSPFANADVVTDEKVAGRAARCATVVSGAVTFAICIDSEIGILLRTATDRSDGNPTVLAATSVEVGSVDPAVFELPATPPESQ